MEETQEKHEMISSDQRSEKEQVVWYYRTWVIISAILTFGALGLFLLWFRPNTKLNIKISVSIIVLFLTIWMALETAHYYELFKSYYNSMMSNLESLKQ